ncbi:MAG: glycosyltransferase family 39 protein [Parcubacteria group bacterium]|jgi:hypothetical protein
MNLTKKNTISILIAIVLIGAFLRLYNLGATSFVADEFLDINSSMAYAKTGTWQNWDFNFGKINTENEFAARDERAWPYKWQVAQVLKLSKPAESTARTVSVLWGIISIILIYYVATYFTKKKEIGLIAAFLFAVSMTGIIFDRRLRMYSMFFPMYLAFSWMTFRFLEEEYKGKIKLVKFFYDKWKINLIYAIPVVVLGAISILTHQLTANIIFVILFYAAFQLYGEKKRSSLYNKYFLIIIALVAGYIVAAIFFSKNLAAYTAGLGMTNHATYIIKVFADYSHWIIAALILGYGIWWLYKKASLPKESLWLSVSFLGVLLLASFFWNRNVGEQYIFFIESFGIILIASGIYATSEFFGRNLSQYGKRALYVPIILALLILPNWAYFFEDSNTYKQTSDSSSANYKKIFYYFNKARKPDDVLITRNFRNFYWAGDKVRVYDFGGELSKTKLSVDDIKKIQSENVSGWLIISDNDTDYIANDAMDYVSKNLEKVSNTYVRGQVSVYRWGNQQ